MKHAYKATDICILVPTKDRPHKIVNLLTSLVDQTAKVGRIIIVASGQDIAGTVEKYRRRLPVEYYHIDPPGQIRQRIFGVSKLNRKTKIVATLDDDIILEADAIQQIVHFWNINPGVGGVGFNITNFSPHVFSRFKAFFFASAREPGRVLKSGFVTPITSVSADTRTDWLNGGTTTWRQDILISALHKREINTPWAPCEDLLFSYPCGRQYPLYICRSARVIHDDINPGDLSYPVMYYRGKMISLWTLYFVVQNPELSPAAFALAVVMTSTAGILLGLFAFRFRKCWFEFGRIRGAFSGLFHIMRNRDIVQLIH